jgi:hypothetical protein
MDREREVHWIREDAEFARGNGTRGEPMPDELAEIDPILQRFQEAPYDELEHLAKGWSRSMLVAWRCHHARILTRPPDPFASRH